MKAILISIKPQWVAKILNGKKTIEIRKTLPKCDLPIDVYIYCTKDKNLLRKVIEYDESSMNWYQPHYEIINDKNCNFDILNGKVVARFWCDKVEEIYNDSDEYYECYYQTNTLAMEDLLKQSCLDYNQLNDYLCEEQGTAIHITKLEIFNKPKELKEFFVYSHSVAGVGLDGKDKTFEILKPLTKAPQSYCFIRDVL